MRKKDKAHYKILVVSDQEKNPIKQFLISFEVLIAFCAIIVLLWTSMLIYCYLLTEERNISNKHVKTYQVQNEELSKQNTDLIKENRSYKKKLQFLAIL